MSIHPIDYLSKGNVHADFWDALEICGTVSERQWDRVKFVEYTLAAGTRRDHAALLVTWGPPRHDPTLQVSL